jgi:hypothetical protein
VPAGQLVQTGADFGVPALVRSVPAGHSPTGTQLAWFADDAYVPSAQGAHSASLALVGATFTQLPGSHVFHGAQLAAFVVVL